MINVYDSKSTNFNNNGLVVLDSPIVAEISEELNGQYELDIEYPLGNTKWQYLIEGNIVKADGQLFRIYHKVKNLESIKVNCRHITYDLLDNFIEDITLTNTSGTNALDTILSSTQYAHNFISMSDVSNTFTANYAKKNPIEIIMGTNGIISNIGGELVRDNFTIKLLQNRGLDRGVLISYSKNIIGIEETLDIDGICTRLMPVGKDGLLLTEKYIDSQYINNFPHPKIRTVEFSDCEDEATLRTTATKYMADNKIDIPQFNYVVDFVELSKTEEYKNYSILETVYLGDTVTIKHSKLNINLKAKVIKITKNELTNRIEKVELGSFKANLATSINSSIQEVKAEIVQVTSDYQKAIDNATALITGSNGGNIVIRGDKEGHPTEILIMDTTDINTAKNVWRWNSGGFGFSSNGYNGNFDTAITMDGHIVASFITALTISGNNIIGGTISGCNLRTSNTSNYIQFHDQFADFFHENTLMMKIGFDEDMMLPLISFNDTGSLIMGVTGGLDIAVSQMVNVMNSTNSAILKVNNNNVATESWVQSQNYITSTSLSSTLGMYATTSSLSSYVTNTLFINTLSSYVTNTTLSATLGGYVAKNGNSVYLPNGCSIVSNGSNVAFYDAYNRVMISMNSSELYVGGVKVIVP